MFYYTSLDRVLEKNELSPISTDITMFNEDNSLTIVMDTYLQQFQNCKMYVNGKLYKGGASIYDIGILYQYLRGLGFGKDYDVTWSLFMVKTKKGLYGIVDIYVPVDSDFYPY